MEKANNNPYNPFKMIGSYIGIIIFLLLKPFLYNIPILKYIVILPYTLLFTISRKWDGFTGYLIMTIINSLPVTLMGFFVGWGIHYLIKKRRAES